MKITRISAFAIKIPRDAVASTGTAGSPAPLLPGESDYRFASSYQTLYSSKIETVLIRIETSAGVTGWGEAQSPIAPEVVCTITKTILAPVLEGENPMKTEKLWSLMYNSMRVRGHTGSFYLDAIAGIDMALWDIKGKALRTRVCDLIGGPFAEELPAYISGLSGKDSSKRVEQALEYQSRGFDAFKIFMEGTKEELLDLHDSLREGLGGGVRIMVDALWRLDQAEAKRFGRELDSRRVSWLEAPLNPEDIDGHAHLARELNTPIAIGESWRSRWEMRGFFDAGALQVYQPDVGRTGITEGMKLCALAELHNVPVAFHVSIGLGVQISAALHVAASIPNLMFVECNPKVWEVAGSFLKRPVLINRGTVSLPEDAGLGVEIDEEKLQTFIVN